MFRIFSCLLTILLVISVIPFQSYASEMNELNNSLLGNGTYPCAEPNAKLSCDQINKMLTDSAIEHRIPPEVVKAIAFQESTWQQWEDSEQSKPNISSDGGIGIMQVTDTEHLYDQEKLKTSIQYNINAGLDILNKKWQMGIEGIIPTINDNSRNVIENWYFAVMAYNGLKEVNSPTIKDDGSKNLDAYQEKVFQIIKEYNNNLPLVELSFSRDDFQYEHGDDNTDIKFNKLNYQFKGPVTKSRHLFTEGDKVYTVVGTYLRDTKDGDGSTFLGGRHIAEIIDETIKYDTSDQSPGRHWVRYHIKLEDGRTGYVASGAIEPITSRLSGNDRYETAVKISELGWQDGANTVVIATGKDFPDALSGAPLAYKYNAPILLTSTKEQTEVTRQEISRLGAEKVIILGGYGAVSEEVENELKTMNLQEINRIGGKNRYETAQLIAEKLNSSSDVAIVATGMNFPDALAVAPYAARNGIPILLTQTHSLPEFTKEALLGKSTVYVIGGESVVSAQVANTLPGVRRIAGKNRFETASKIISTFDFGDKQALVATGNNFPDALTGAVLAAKKNAPLLLVGNNIVTDSIENTIKQRTINNFILLGGESVLKNTVKNQLAKIATNN